MKRNGSFVLAVFLIITMFPLSTLCQAPTEKPSEKPAGKPKMEPLPQAAVDYLDALAAFNKANGRKSVEILFNLAWNAARSLSDESDARRYSYLDRMSEDNFPVLKKTMIGLAFYPWGSDYGCWSWPDYEFFLELSKAKGLDVDIAFFDLIRGYPQGYPHIGSRWADENGITKWNVIRSAGEKLVLFGKKHPDNYQNALNDELDILSQELMDCPCIYEDRREALKEYRSFMAVVTNYPLNGWTKERLKNILQSIESGKNEMSFSCRSYIYMSPH